MPEPYAWDCTNPHCRRRNVWENAHCRECHWPRSSGVLLYTAVPSVSESIRSFDLVDWLDGLFRRHTIWYCVVVGLLCVTGLVTWPFTFGLVLLWIGKGVWKLVQQKEQSPSTPANLARRSPTDPP